MNLQELVDAVDARGYSFTQAADDATNPILIILNSVYRNINGNQRWPWLQKQDTSLSTTVGTQYYDLASVADLRQLDAVRLQDSQGTYNLKYAEPQAFETMAADRPDNSLPQYWSIVRNQIGLLPTPDSTYTIVLDYVYSPPDLATTTDTPVFPAIYHDVLVWGVVSELAYRERDYWSSNLAAENYQQRYKQMEQEYMLRQVQTSSRVKRSGFFDDVDWFQLGWGVDG